MITDERSPRDSEVQGINFTKTLHSEKVQPTGNQPDAKQNVYQKEKEMKGVSLHESKEA